jgi:hypothetical protein
LINGVAGWSCPKGLPAFGTDHLGTNGPEKAMPRFTTGHSFDDIDNFFCYFFFFFLAFFLVAIEKIPPLF